LNSQWLPQHKRNLPKRYYVSLERLAHISRGVVRITILKTLRTARRLPMDNAHTLAFASMFILRVVFLTSPRASPQASSKASHQASSKASHQARTSRRFHNFLMKSVWKCVFWSYSLRQCVAPPLLTPSNIKIFV